MRYPFDVRVVQRFENFFSDLARLLLIERVLFDDLCEQLLAFEVLGDQEEAVLDLVEFVELEDVRVVEMDQHVNLFLGGVVRRLGVPHDLQRPA